MSILLFFCLVICYVLLKLMINGGGKELVSVLLSSVLSRMVGRFASQSGSPGCVCEHEAIPGPKAWIYPIETAF